jgi:PKD repeat protein
MKNYITYSIRLLIVFLGIGIFLPSCQYKEITEAQYPDQKIYMPSSYNGVFAVNTVALPVGNTTPGNTYRYIIDMAARKFIVPLGVYRSGIDNIGAFTVKIAVNTDTITKLLTSLSPKLPVGTTLLPATVYSTVNTVEMKDGEETAIFNFSIDLDFLLANYPAKNFAIGITISSSARETSKGLGTTVLLLGTDMMKPTASFTSVVSSSDVKTWNFNSTSMMTVGYSWDFGDGTPTSTIRSPSHKYATSGSYTITFTALGVTGQENKSIKTATITVL